MHEYRESVRALVCTHMLFELFSISYSAFRCNFRILLPMYALFFVSPHVFSAVLRLVLKLGYSAQDQSQRAKASNQRNPKQKQKTRPKK